MKATMHAGDAIESCKRGRALIDHDLSIIDKELDHVNKLANQSEAPEDLRKRALAKAKALETSAKAAGVIRQRLTEMERQLSAVPPECEVELSAAEMMLFAYGGEGK